jgi:hypothetical protein
MNGFFVLVLAATIFGFIVWIPLAIEKDREDRRMVHLFHGPHSKCIECEDK